MDGMEVIQPAHLNQRPSLAPLLGATVVATFSIVFGIVIAYMAIATPVLKAVIPEGRLNAGQAATGIIVWSIALVAPTAFVLIGANRLVRILAATRARTPRRSADAPRTGFVARRCRGRHGYRDAGRPSDLRPRHRPVRRRGGPRAAAGRRDARPRGRWQLRTRRGWIVIESPLERAARDAERVRRWLAHDDADFIVKAYAAVVGSEPTITADDRLRRPDPRPAGSVDRRAAAAAQPDGGPTRAGARVRPRRSALSRRKSITSAGRGARTRTWNQRDISPPL